MKKNKGVTLIALVVTIIVLLILAGVTISMLKGENGIIKQAENAKDSTIVGKETEAVSIAYSMKKAKSNKSKITADEMQEEMARNGEDVEVTEESNKLVIKYNETGNTYKIEQETGKIHKETTTASGGSGGTGSSTGGSTGGGSTGDSTGESSIILKPGDYVEYTVPSKQSRCYANGILATINTSNYQGKWQVLYADATHGIQIVSSDVVGTAQIGGGATSSGSGAAMEGMDAYNNIVDLQKQYAEYYLNTDLATNARGLGSPADFSNDIENVYEGTSLKVDDSTSNNYQEDINALKQIGIFNTTSSYWLTSRKYEKKEYTSYSVNSCQIRYIDNGEEKSQEVYFDTSSGGFNGNTGTYGERPVILLKTGIKITGGLGTAQSPYKISI